MAMKIKTEYDEKIKGNFSAFDRMIFKGHLSAFYKKGNMRYYLWEEKVLLKEFGKYAESITEKIKANAKNIADKEKRPYKYIAQPLAATKFYFAVLAIYNAFTYVRRIQ